MIKILDKIKQLIDDFSEIKQLPNLSISLYANKAVDDPFYHNIICDFFNEATRRHPKFLVIPQYKYGFAVSDLSPSFDEFIMKIEPSARRNYKKALKKDYIFKKLDFNENLDGIKEIRTSTKFRQGEVSDEMFYKEIKPNVNPTPKDSSYGYPYFGVFNKEGKLVAYAGCLVSGEISIMESIYGHAKYQNDGIVPFLVANIAKLLIEESTNNVKYFSYGTYYGAGTTMRRFKKKLDFKPHNVAWKLT